MSSCACCASWCSCSQGWLSDGLRLGLHTMDKQYPVPRHDVSKRCAACCPVQLRVLFCRPFGTRPKRPDLVVARASTKFHARSPGDGQHVDGGGSQLAIRFLLAAAQADKGHRPGRPEFRPPRSLPSLILGVAGLGPHVAKWAPTRPVTKQQSSQPCTSHPATPTIQVIQYTY